MSDPADDDLEGAMKLDLSAWEAPEPPQTAEELADSVISRLAGTEVGAAVPVEEHRASPRRRTLVIAGVAAAVIAVSVGVWGLVRNTEHAAAREGFVRADKAQTLSLGDARAELDPGADVHWHRTGAVLDVEQRKGNVTWRVGTEVKLVIDAGATVASVEATGASLRVEVQPMNATDVRVIGATAVTAMAVSLVTVVVYEGHVKVHGNQQTVIVEPGSTYKVLPPVSPPEVTLDEPIVGVGPIATAPGEIDVSIPGGENAMILDPSPPTAVQINTRTVCKGAASVSFSAVSSNAGIARLDPGYYAYAIDCAGVVTNGVVKIRRDDLRRPIAQQPFSADDDTTPVIQLPTDATWRDDVDLRGLTVPGAEVSVDGVGVPIDGTGRFVALVAANGRASIAMRVKLGMSVFYAIARPAKPRVVTVVPPGPIAVSLDAQTITGVMASLRGAVDACDDAHPSHGTLKLHVKVGPDGKVIAVDVTQSLGAALDDCVRALVLAAKFPATQQGGAFAYPYALMRDHSTPNCDATALKDKGMENVNMGQHGAALMQFEASLRCKQDPFVLQLAFMAACNAQNKPKAQTFYDQLSPDQRTRLKMMCVRNKITLDDSPAPPPACDPDIAKDKGMALLNAGKHAAALSMFEKSLACKADPYVTSLAFMSSCNSQNAVKAKQYYAQLSPDQQQKLAPMCVRNKIDVTASSQTSAACDATKLKDQGMDAVNQGAHALALHLFEKSLSCKQDAYVTQLAFMSACNGENPAKAKFYYAKLAPSQQQKLMILCVRNNVDVTSKDPDTKGYLALSSKPSARILVDGVDIGLTTPIAAGSLALDPGKHKVTFIVGQDRFTYIAVIKAGSTATLSKDLQ